MNTKLTHPASADPLSPALTLRDACHRTGHDAGGNRCPDCPLKGLCENEKRWLIERVSWSRLN